MELIQNVLEYESNMERNDSKIYVIKVSSDNDSTNKKFAFTFYADIKEVITSTSDPEITLTVGGYTKATKEKIPYAKIFVNSYIEALNIRNKMFDTLMKDRTFYWHANTYSMLTEMVKKMRSSYDFKIKNTYNCYHSNKRGAIKPNEF